MMNREPFTVKMDPSTKEQITRLLEAMTIDFEPVLSVCPDWFPRKEGEAMFRVVWRNEDGERTVHSLGVPADFRLDARETPQGKEHEHV
jgi:hypothetical protein